MNSRTDDSFIHGYTAMRAQLRDHQLSPRDPFETVSLDLTGPAVAVIRCDVEALRWIVENLPHDDVSTGRLTALLYWIEDQQPKEKTDADD